MDADQLMAGPVYALRPEDSVHHARGEMISRGVSKFPVVRDGSDVAGMLTKSDIVFSSDYREAPGKRTPLQDHRVGEIMTEDVYTVQGGAPMEELVAEMDRRNISGVPVTNPDGEVEGIVTETDLLPRLAGDLRGKARIQDVMSDNLVTVHPQTSLPRAIRRMEESKIHQLPVLEDEEHLVGILTMSDIVFSAWFEPGRRSGKRVSRRAQGEDGRRPRERVVDGIVDEAMTDEVDTASPDQDLQTAAEVLRRERYNALPVRSGDEGIDGIVTRTDLIRRWLKER